MSRAVSLVSRLAAVVALALVAALLSPLAAGQADPAPPEMSFFCAQKSSGTMRYVTSDTACTKTERLVTVKPGPVLVCAVPGGSTKSVTRPSQCQKPAIVVTLPPTSGTVYFCVTTATGAIRYVASPSLCATTEFLVQVTPNDDAPTIESTSPLDGATGLATTTNASLTFSEAVTVDTGALTLVCNGTTEPFTLTGSGTATVTLDPDDPLPAGVQCIVSVPAAAVHDVDTLDPPDTMAAPYSFDFSTDAPPALMSSVPANGATDIATASSISLTFSEVVTVAPGAFQLACPAAQPFGLSGSGTSTITVTPSGPLPVAATCTLSGAATDVTDVDNGDPPDALTTPISLSFTTADTAPAVTATTPADEAEHVATTTGVSVTFSEPVTLQGGAVTLSCDGTPVTMTLTANGPTVWSYDPDQDLAEGADCTGTVHANLVTDTDGVDPPDNPVGDSTFDFTVDAAPWVVSVVPNDLDTDVAPGTDVTFTFSEPVTVTGASFSLACDTGSGATAVPFALSGSGTATVTLNPSADLPGTASCTATAVAAQVSDVDGGDPPDHPTSDATSRFTTVDTAPSVVSTVPADGASSAPRDTNIVVTFSEPVASAASAFELTCLLGTPLDVVLSGSGTSVLTIDPAADLPTGELCTLLVKGAGVHDVDGIDPPDVMDADYPVSFTVSPNSAPTDIALSNALVAENLPVATAVGTLSSTDPDAGDTFTYSLVSGTGSTDNASFSISGSELRTAAVFDLETKSSYSVRVRTTDSAGGFFEESFTITVTDVNEVPTDITLSSTSVAENLPTGTAVGTLGVVDPDAGQTHTFAVVTSGCGGTFADGSAFTVSSGSLVTAAALDFEAKSSYAVCLRVTDSGTPPLSRDEQATITVADANDAPTVVNDSYSGAIGNTLAVLGTTGSGPSVSLSGTLPLVNDSDEDATFPHTISAVAATVSTVGGGVAVIGTTGSFTFLPAAGASSTTDSFTYQVTDGSATTSGTISVVIGADRVWYVNGAAGANGDGRSTNPFNVLTTLDGAAGAGDVDSSGDHLFLYGGSTYAGGLVLEAGQRLYGQPHGLTVGGVGLVAAGGTAPTIANAAGNGLELASSVDVQGVAVGASSGDGIRSVGVGSATVGTVTAVSVTGATGDGIEVSGGSGTLDLGVTVTATGSARSVAVGGRTGGTVTFSRTVSGTGVALTSNTGASVAFTGALSISSGTSPAFSATGGGTVTATDATSTLVATTGAGVVVENTTIGAADLTFRSVTVNGAVNGIRLTSTGDVGGLSVVGSGSTTLGGDGSGGTIANTTGAGVALNGTRDVSLRNVTMTNTAAAGVSGTDVTNFAFTNGTVDGSGQTGLGLYDSNISLDSAASLNVDGTVSITGSRLLNAYQHGVDVGNRSGTISTLTVTGNTITSTTSKTTSKGSGILVVSNGTAATGATVSKGSLSGNTVTNFPSGAGIVVTGGNTATSGAPAATVGSGPVANALAIDGNLIRGQSSTNPMNTNCILVSIAGRGSGFVDVTNNGTAGTPLAFAFGNCISVNATGSVNLTSQVRNNYVRPQLNMAAVPPPNSFGIGFGAGNHVMADTSVLDSAVINVTVTGNTVSDTPLSGIFGAAREGGTVNATVTGNTVGTPLTLAGIYGIRLESGAGGVVGDAKVCAQFSSNTTSGSLNTATSATAPGIGVRKEGPVSTTNDFGLVGLSPSPATAAATEGFLDVQNPLSAHGSFTSGARVISGDNFTACNLSQ